MTNTIKLLTDSERVQLPSVLLRRKKFRNLVETSIKNFRNTFNNCIMISGKAGTGKTTVIEELLNEMLQDENISSYKAVRGHVTPKSLFGLLMDTASNSENGANVLLLDDVDCLNDEGCLELLKSSFDTRSCMPTNRKVYYASEGRRDGFKYEGGFGIIITNEQFNNPDKISVHQQALLDRVQLLSADLQPKDMMIFTTSLVEDYLNQNPDNLTKDQIDSTVDLFNTDIRRWIETGAFKEARINFSIRLIKKFIDAERIFGEDWRDFNITYQKLQNMSDMIEARKDSLIEDVSIPSKNQSKMPTFKNGLFIKRNGMPYCETNQANLRRKYGIKIA